MVAALGVGWLLSELVHGQTSASPSRIEVDRQVRELLDAGVPGIHFYVLNRSPATSRVLEQVGRARA